MTRPATVMIVDNGSLSTAAIARHVRAAGLKPRITACANLEPPTLDVTGVILTGTDVPAPSSVYNDEVELIQTCEVPLLGICGGMHLIGRAFGEPIANCEAAVGRCSVTLEANVPIFQCLPSTVTLFQRHRYQLAGVPTGCDRIAHSVACDVEGLRHRTRQIYGMQAHLEFRRDGQAILDNFLELTGTRGTK